MVGGHVVGLDVLHRLVKVGIERLALAVEGLDAVLAEGDSVGTVLFEGRGAGAGPTASSVVADIMDIARGVSYKPFTLPVASLSSIPFSGMEHLRGSYYLRLSVLDKPGVLSDVTDIFKKENISLQSFLQPSAQADGTAQLVLTTHETQEAAMMRAIKAITELQNVKEPPTMIRIEEL